VPYLDKEGEVLKCDRCNLVENYSEELFEIHHFWNFVIFKGKHKPDFGLFCLDCSKKITPLMYQLRDICELQLFVNNLWRKTNEQRKKADSNNRAIA
jgi:hypothetical protein